jgi:cysteinyl-tRNA synthetase
MRLYSSLSRRKEELPPPPGPVGMYFCGPTVYHRIHVGNARPYIVSLWLKRWLEGRGYEVKLVENVTDINDKIYEAAARQKMRSDELARLATGWYFEDTDALGLGRPDVEPLATESLPEIIALIEELVARGLAYESGGDVYFRVAAFPDYGALSGADPDEMVAQEPSDLKEDPRDFALWKAMKLHEDTSWESPWGRGRPGWHIECSAMAEKHLGPGFDVHGGGLDLRFPHHENELAQSRGAGREFARVWAHNGMLRLDEAKMSKSVGNIVSLREALDRWGRETVLVFFLGAHYRNWIDFSEEAMDAAAAEAERFRNAFRGASEGESSREWDDFVAVLDEDFSTPEALAILHEWRSAGRQDLLLRGLGIFGLGSLAHDHEPPPEVVALARAREEARVRRDFAEADGFRQHITELGWEVRDVPGGFQLVRKR